MQRKTIASFDCALNSNEAKIFQEMLTTLLMPGLFVSLGYQQPWYWVCKINGPVFHKEGFQLPVPCHCWKMIENTNLFFFYVPCVSWNGLSTTRVKCFWIIHIWWFVVEVSMSTEESTSNMSVHIPLALYCFSNMNWFHWPTLTCAMLKHQSLGPCISSSWYGQKNKTFHSTAKHP